MAKKNYKKLLERSRALAEDLRRFSFFAGTEQGKRFDELKAEALDLLDGKIVPELASSLTLPLFVAVLGGTNTGKSTVFNALAGVLLSETKITAGATKHPLVYVHQRWEKELLEGQVFDRIRCERLESPGQLLCVYDEPRMFFSFHDRKELKDVAFIDSPDFDSSEPHNRETAHKVLTQADVCLFLTTPQKYKDRVLVEDLETIAGQQKRVLVIFNLVADEMLFRTMADDLKVRVGDKVAFGGYLPDTEHKDPERALRERVNGIVDGFLKGLKRAEIKEATLHQGLRSLIARVRRLVESYKAEAGRKDDIIAEIAAQRKNVLTEYRRDFALGFPELSEALRRRMRSYEVRRLIPGTAGRKTGWLGLVHHATGLVGSRLTGAFAQTLEGEHRPADWERFQQKRDNDDLLRVKQLGQLLRARVDNHLRARASTSALCLSLLKDFFDQEGLERFDETVEGAYRAALAA
ncbi:MAG: GTPase [Planctomycetota bacterium]